MGRILFTPRRATAPVVYPVKYGLLYNFYAVSSAKFITAANAHVPSSAEFDALITACGGQIPAGDSMRDINPLYWIEHSYTNLFGFNGRGTGDRRKLSGIFENTKSVLCTWLTETSGYNAYHSQIGHGSAATNYLDSHNYGYSLRLVVDSPIEINGANAVYVGNDGKRYRCKLIGGVWWLADNLAETKFRNGDWIHGYDGGIYKPISNTEWAALTTAGCCAYNNDWNNV